MNYHNAPNFSAYRKIRILIFILAVVLLLLQLLIDFSIYNAVSSVVVVCSIFICFNCLVRYSIFQAAPLPAVAVLGHNFSSMSGALLFQTLDSTSLVSNLRNPLFTFGGSALLNISLIIALLIVFRSRELRILSSYPRRFIVLLKLFERPDNIQLWVMGVIGISSLVWTAGVRYSGDIQYGDVVSKFIFGLNNLAFAPFLIPVMPVIFGKSNFEGGKSNSRIYLILYFFVLTAVAVASNSRGIFAMGVTNLLFIFILYWAIGQLVIDRGLIKKIVVIFSLVMAVSPIFSDLAIAMVIARTDRASLTPVELMDKTIEVFNSKDELTRHRVNAVISVSDNEYNEVYIDNVFIQRLISTKFIDNTVSLDRTMDGGGRDFIFEITMKKIFALFPTSILNLVNSDLKKEDLEFSLGDLLYYSEHGNGLGMYRVGSSLGHGFALFGVLFFVVMIPVFVVTFVALNIFTLRRKTLVISPVVLLQTVSVYYLASGDGITEPIFMFVRSLPQNIFLYLVIFWMVAGFVRIFCRRSLV